MNPPTVGRSFSRRGGTGATLRGGTAVALFLGVVICVSGCGGRESSESTASGSPEAEPSAAGLEAGSVAPLGTGFIMVSARSQLRLDEPSYLEESDCMLQVSTRRDAEEYAGCMEIPRNAICLQVTLGYREADRFWECFVEPTVCEDRTAEHDVLWQLVKDERAILQSCAERELASVFGV